MTQSDKDSSTKIEERLDKAKDIPSTKPLVKRLIRDMLEELDLWDADAGEAVHEITTEYGMALIQDAFTVGPRQLEELTTDVLDEAKGDKGSPQVLVESAAYNELLTEVTDSLRGEGSANIEEQVEQAYSRVELRDDLPRHPTKDEFVTDVKNRLRHQGFSLEKKARFQEARDNIKETLKGKRSPYSKDRATEIAYQYIVDTYDLYAVWNGDDTELWVYSNGHYTPNNTLGIYLDIKDLFQETFCKRYKNRVLEKIYHDENIAVKHEEFFQLRDTNGIVFTNGIYDLEKEKLVDHTPDRIFFNLIPWPYQPEQDCQQILNHLDEVIEHEEDIKALQEFFGLMLLPEYVRAKSLILVGDGSNGKSVTLNILQKALGGHNCVNIGFEDINSETGRFKRHRLRGKLANIGGDISSNTIEQTQHFKALTGRDMVNEDRKHDESVGFENYATMAFAANEVPYPLEDSHAFWRRWIYIDFPYTFKDDLSQEEQDDPLVKEKKQDQLDSITTREQIIGLLTWGVEGASRMLEEGFSDSKTTEDVRRRWLYDSSSFAEFADKYIEENWNAKIRKDDLQRAYNLFCYNRQRQRESKKTQRKHLENEYAADQRGPVSDFESAGYDEDEYQSSMPRVFEGVTFKEDVERKYDSSELKHYSRFDTSIFDKKLDEFE